MAPSLEYAEQLVKFLMKASYTPLPLERQQTVIPYYMQRAITLPGLLKTFLMVTWLMLLLKLTREHSHSKDRAWRVQNQRKSKLRNPTL